MMTTTRNQEASTLDQIQRTANARFELYRRLGRGERNPDFVTQIQALDARLGVLWDQHRRELAGQRIGDSAATAKPEPERRIA